MSTLRVLITGATGFIGINLVNAIKKCMPAVEINVLIRNPNKSFMFNMLSNIKIRNADIMNKPLLDNYVNNIDIVFHLCGVLGKWGLSDQLYWDINVEGTRNLIKACLENGSVKHFVYLSSAGVLGSSINNADESFALNPSNIYEKTKAEAERIAMEYYNRQGFPVTILRPEFVYGPYDRHVLGLFKAIKHGLLFLVEDGISVLHPTYIGDLTGILLGCIYKINTAGRVYIVAGERSLTVKEFVALIAKYLKVRAPFISVSRRSALLGAYAFESMARIFKINPILTKSRVSLFTDSRSYNTAKAKRDLGFVPSSLEDSVRETVNWYILNNYL